MPWHGAIALTIQHAACNLVHTCWCPKPSQKQAMMASISLSALLSFFFLTTPFSFALITFHPTHFFTLSIPPPRRVQQSCSSALPAVLSAVARGVCIFQISISRAILVASYSSVQGFGTAIPHVVLSCLLGCPHPPESPQSRDLLHIIKWSSQHMFCDEFLISSSAVWERNQFAGRLFAVGSPHF